MPIDRPSFFHAGRGTATNASPTRFNLNMAEADGDWLDDQMLVDGGPAPLRTRVAIEKPKSILARNTSPDIPFDRSINPYRGCEHGCVYCYARPTHAYHDLSPGLDFETRLFAKPDAAALLQEALSKPSYRAAPIAFGTNTDPYQPIERDWRITRACLELLCETEHPVTITTKSDRVIRDIDILARMAAKGLAAVAVSITSLTPATHRSLEPRAPRPEKRLAALRALSAAGIPTHVMVAPIIPAITDHEIEAILAASAQNGAQTASFIPIRLPHEVSPLFRAWLDTHYPDRASKVMHLIQSMRGGRDNDPAFTSRMRGTGVWADLIRTRFKIAAKKNGLNERTITLRNDLFRPPQGDQYSLL